MEPQSSQRRQLQQDSINSNGKKIVEVHSPISKQLPKTFMETLMKQRPVLHKYSPEQVEVVYHRRTGDEVVARRRSKAKSNDKRKGKKQASDNESNLDTTVTSDVGELSFDSTFTEPSSPRPAADSLRTPQIKSVHELLSGATDVDLTVNPAAVQNGALNSTSDNCSIRSSLQDCNDVETVQTCLDRLDQVAAMIVDMNDNMAKMESRVKNLELATSAIDARNNLLCKKFTKHLNLNTSVASDMKKLQILLNNNVNSSMEAAATLLKKARVRRTKDESRNCSGQHENSVNPEIPVPVHDKSLPSPSS